MNVRAKAIAIAVAINIAGVSYAATPAGRTKKASGKKAVATKNELPVPALREFETERRVELSYDRFQDRTSVSLDEIKLRAEFPQLSLRPSFEFVGEKLSASSPRFVLVFTSYSSIWMYARDHSLTLLVDGERMPIQNVSHDGVVVTARTLAEVMAAPLTRSQFLRIAHAKTVEGRLGSLGEYSEFRLEEEALEGFRKLAACLRQSTLEVLGEPASPEASP